MRPNDRIHYKNIHSYGTGALTVCNVQLFILLVPKLQLGNAFIVEAPASTRPQKALRREAGASRASVFPS